MSETHSPDSGNPLTGVFNAANKLTSARGNHGVPTTLESLSGTASSIISSTRHALGTALSLPVAAVETVVAGANNTVGFLTEVIDNYIAVPISQVRAGIYNVLAGTAGGER